jgi:hypothetical protein
MPAMSTHTTDAARTATHYNDHPEDVREPAYCGTRTGFHSDDFARVTCAACRAIYTEPGTYYAEQQQEGGR